MSGQPPPPGRPNGPPRPRPTNVLRPNRPKPSIFASHRKTNPNRPAAAARPPKPTPEARQKALEQRRKENGGWSEPAPEGCNDIPIMTTKRELLDGLRFHMMRFYQPKANSAPVDPTNDDEFARPVTLHRRDPRQPPAARAPKTEEPEAMPVDALEIERLEALKAEKEAQKAIDQSKIAPVAKDANPKPKKKQKEERTQFHRTYKSEAARKESELRYEEALPWHLEDADGKNVWVGNYVAALSGNNVAFKIDGSVFRMVPLEKWYKFTSKPAFKVLNIDEAENYMARKMDVGRWVMKDEEKKANKAELDATRRMLGGGARMVKTESSTFKAASRAEKMEHDDLDVSGDEFQDDDEAPTFERNNDEDEKDAKERIRREQLGANLWGEGDEQQVEKELNEQLKEELERRKYGESTKKALIKRDREDVYESDKSEENPWSSSVSFFPPILFLCFNAEYCGKEVMEFCKLTLSSLTTNRLTATKRRTRTRKRRRAKMARPTLRTAKTSLRAPRTARLRRTSTRALPRRARVSRGLGLLRYPSPVETSPRARRRLRRRLWVAEPALRRSSRLQPSARPRVVLAREVTARPPPARCLTGLDPRRRSSSRAAVVASAPRQPPGLAVPTPTRGVS